MTSIQAMQRTRYGILRSGSPCGRERLIGEFQGPTMQRYRLLLFSSLGLAVAFVAAFFGHWGGNVAADFPLLVTINVIAGLCVAAIVFGTVWHALARHVQACRHGGHLREMLSFEVCGVSPEP